MLPALAIAWLAILPAAARGADRPYAIEPGLIGQVLPGFTVTSGTEVALSLQPACTGPETAAGAVRLRRRAVDGVPPPLDVYASDPPRAPGVCNPSALRSNLAFDGVHLWFVDGFGFLSKLAKDAPPGAPLDPEFATSVEAGAPLAEVVWAPDAVYVLQPGPVSSIVRFEPGGSPSGTPIATGGPSTSDLQFDGTDLFWLDAGSLRRWTPGLVGVATLASDVSSYYAEGNRSASCGPFLCLTRNVYTGNASGQVHRRADGGTGGPELVYQSPALAAAVVGIVTDASRLFVLERRPNDDPGSPFPRFALLRASRTTLAPPALLYVTDFLTLDPAVAMDSLRLAGGFLVWRSLESGAFGSIARLRRLSTDAEAIAERDLEVTGIEVTQAIQDLANRVPLVAGRKTFARVHVRASGADVANVSAVLRGRRGALSIGSLVPVNAPSYRLRVPAAPRRVVRDEAFLFELPWSWVTAGSDLVLEAELNPNRVPPEPGYANNVRSLGPLTFAPSPRFRLLLNRMRYRRGGVEYAPSNADVQRILDFYRRVYPLASFEGPISSSLAGFLVSQQVVTDDALASRVDQSSGECSDNLCASDYLNARRDVYGFGGQALPADVYAFNLVDDRVPMPQGGTFFARGRAGLGGRVGSGSVQQDFIGAHETGHNLRRDHPVRASGEAEDGPPQSPDTVRCGHSAGDAGFPYADTLLDDSPVERQADVLGFDVLGRSVLAPTTTDMIGYCNPSGQWISDYTWNAIRAEMLAAQGGGGGGAGGAGGGEAGDWLVFSGRATPSQGRGRFLEVQRVAEIVRPWTDDAGPYRLRQRAADGELLAERAFSGAPDPDAAIPQDGFTGAVLLDPGTRSIELFDARAGAGLLDARTILQLPPTLTGVALAGPPGALSGPATLVWDATSPLGAALRFDVFGVTPAGLALPLVQGLSVESAEIDGSALAGPEVRFRVVAHDGVNTAVAESPPYPVAARAPTARILAPEGAATIGYGQLLNLWGVGEDPDETAVALDWSTADRVLGSGPQLSVDDLAPGDHVVTLTVTDTGGASASASVPVHVVYETEAPSAPALRVGPEALGFHVSTPDPAAAPSAAIEVANAGPGDLAFAVAASEPWVVVTPSTGVAPATLSVTALPAGFRSGESRTASLTITETGGGGSVDVAVTLSVGTTAVPEPAAAWLGLASVAALGACRRLRSPRSPTRGRRDRSAP